MRLNPLRVLKHLTIPKRKTRYVQLAAACLLMGCGKEACTATEHFLVSKKVKCQPVNNSAYINDFFFLKGERLLRDTIFVDVHAGGELKKGALLSIYDSHSSLASYEVDGFSEDDYFILLKAYYPIGPEISWKPERKVFALHICGTTLSVYQYSNKFLKKSTDVRLEVIQ